MEEIVNPYIAGAPVTEKRMFFGREDVFAWIERSLSGQYADHILVVHGQRRVGKTSVLKQLGNRLPDRYIPVFFDLQGRTHTTLDRFMWWLAREIVRVLKQERDIAITPPDRELFTQDIEYFENRFLPDLKPYLGNDKVLLLTFDEFDNLEESEVKDVLARPLIDHLRRLMEFSNLNFIFSIGSSGRKLENMQAAYTEFFKAALYKKISFLTRDDGQRLITLPVQGIIEYEQDAVRQIYDIVSGHPYFTQLVCHELFSRCQKTGQRTISRADVDAILDDVVERGTVNLKFVWDEAADLEKWSLSALAQLEGKHDNRAVADFLSHQRVRFNQQTLDSALLHLREKDVLTEDNRFVNHLLQIWMKKNRPIEQAREELTEVNPIANRYIEIGLEFKHSGLHDKAADSFKEALEVDSDNLQAQVNLAQVYLDQKNVERAIAEFEKALAIDEEDIATRSGLCDAYLAQGDQVRAKGRPQEAVQAYQKVLTINGEHNEARQRMAEINRQRAEKALDEGRDEEALSAFTDALKYTPEDPTLIARVDDVRAEKKAKVLAAQIARSEKEANARNWEKAIAALNEALETSPKDEAILQKIALIKERQQNERLDAALTKADQAEKAGRWDTAIAALNEYLNLKPGDTLIQKRLSDLIEAKHAAWLSAIITRADQAVAYQNWDEAITALNEVHALEPDNTEIKNKIAEVREARRVAELNALLKRVEGAVQAGRWDDAMDMLNNRIASEPENETLQAKLIEVRKAKREARLKAAMRLVDSATQAGKWDGAIEVLNEILAIEPDNADFQKKLAEVKQEQRESRLASLQTQARGLAKAEKFEEALVAWNEYLALEPDDREKTQAEIESVKKMQALANMYADAYKAYTRKNYEKAASLFKKVVVENADYKDASNLLAQAIELKGTGRKWWQNKLVLSLVVISVVVLGIAWGVFRIGSPLTAALFAPTSAPSPTSAPETAAPATVTQAPITESPTAAPVVSLPYRWARLNAGQLWERDEVISIVFDPIDPGVLYVGTKNAGFYQSIDGGISWQPLSMDGVSSDISEKLRVNNDHNQERGYTVTNVGPDGKTRLYRYATPPTLEISSTSNWRVSEDNGQTWSEFGLMGWPNSAAITFDSEGSVYAYCDSNLCKYSPDGKQQNTLGAPDVGAFTLIAISPYDPNTIYIAGKGLAVSKDGGKTWTKLNNGLGNGKLQLDISSGGSPTLYLQSGECGQASRTGQSRTQRVFQDDAGQPLYISADSGQTWDLSLQNGCYLIKDADDSILYRAGQDWAFTTDANHSLRWIWLSKDRGKSWQTADIMDIGESFTVVAHPKQSGTLYVRSIDSFFGGEKKIISTDYGNNWKDADTTAGIKTCSGSTPQFIDKYRPMAIDPTDGNHVFVVDNGALLESRDSCETTSAFATTPNANMNSIAFDPSNSDTLYAGTNEGAYISYDSGATWGQVNDGLLGATVVYSIVVDKDSNVYAATPYGVFKLESK
jgi:tetratricopeptide (TPR) repeat protein